MKHRFTDRQFRDMIQRYNIQKVSGTSDIVRYTIEEDVLYAMLQTAFLRGVDIDVMKTQLRKPKDDAGGKSQNSGKATA